MKSAFDNNAHGSQASVQKNTQKPELLEDILDDIMEVFSMIMHKGYKHEPTALSYEASDDEGIAVRFRHSSTLDIEEHDDAIKQNVSFYNDMRQFLTQLETLDTDLDIYAATLTIRAENTLSLVDALASYFRQESCNLKISDTAQPNMAEREALAYYGASMAEDNKEAYEYYLGSMPAKGFVSIEHLNASIAARALCDIPVSLEMMRRRIVGVPQNEHAPLTTQERRIMLEDSFSACAQWARKPPSIPSIQSSSFLLERERHMQLASAVHSLLTTHYRLTREIVRGHIQTSIGQVENQIFDMRFECENMPQGKVFGGYYAKFHAFAEDFRKAGEDMSGVTLVPVEDKRLLTIRYMPDDLFKVLVNMVATQHPDNLMAQAHLRAAAQVTERIDLQLPANALN